MQLRTFDDFDREESWRYSVLYNEYFVPLGVRDQVAIPVHRTGNVRVAAACNRVRRSFTPADREVIGLLSSHIAIAYRNALSLASARERTSESGQHSFLGSHIIETDLTGRTIRRHSPVAAEILGAFFGRDTGLGSKLPDVVQRWLRAQKESLLRGEFTDNPMTPLVVERGGRKLTVRLACVRPEEVTLLLDCDIVRENGSGPFAVHLTQREREILHWIAEGKRDSEIGAILGMSPRTVGKHLEHIFAKLGVETRTAAARAAYEFSRQSYV